MSNAGDEREQYAPSLCKSRLSTNFSNVAAENGLGYANYTVWNKKLANISYWSHQAMYHCNIKTS